MTPTDEFLGRRRILEPRYSSMKYQNLHLDQLPLKIIFSIFLHGDNRSKFHIILELGLNLANALSCDLDCPNFLCLGSKNFRSKFLKIYFLWNKDWCRTWRNPESYKSSFWFFFQMLIVRNRIRNPTENLCYENPEFWKVMDIYFLNKNFGFYGLQ